MGPKQAADLGRFLRARREDRGLSTRQLAKETGIHDVSIARMERGEFAAPRPDKLAKLADALGVSRADLYAKAGYVAEGDLPNLTSYLQVKHGLTAELAEHVEQYVHDLAREHGIETNLAAEPSN